MWYILDTEEDRSFCLVHVKNILQAGSDINTSDIVTFYYNGTRYKGKVIAKSMDHDKLTQELSAMTRERRKASSTSAANEGSRQDTKRRSQPTKFFGEPVPEKRTKVERPKVSEEEKTRKRILELNKKEAAKRANNLLLSKIEKQKKTNDDDDNWIPNEEDERNEISSEDESGSDISDFISSNITRKQERKKLMRDLKSNTVASSSAMSSSVVSTINPSSPTKEDLKKEVNDLKVKIQILYDQQLAGRNKDNFSTDGEVQEGTSLMQTPHDSENNEGVDMLNDNKSNDNTSSLDIENICEINESQLLEEQLYGKRHDTVHLTNEIYCRKDVLTKVLAGSNAVSHFVRRIMAGVFIPSKILKCTVSGQSWHAGGPERLGEEMMPLFPKALSAIKDFANAVAKKKGWPPVKKASKLRPIFSGRLQEIKKQFNDGKLRD